MLFATPQISTPEDLQKPQIGIASVWWEGNPCNMHLLDLSADVQEGLPDETVGYRFNTIGVSDGISMGTRGMCYRSAPVTRAAPATPGSPHHSLQSRDLIADSIETVMGAQW